MKTELQKKLAAAYGSIAIETIWTEDEDGAQEWDELAKPGNCFEGENRDNWQCWQSEVRASAIVNGEVVTGSAYMGATWERYGDDPHKSNPTISGYEDQMTVEALEDLAKLAPDYAAPITALIALI